MKRRLRLKTLQKVKNVYRYIKGCQLKSWLLKNQIMAIKLLNVSVYGTKPSADPDYRPAKLLLKRLELQRELKSIKFYKGTNIHE